MNSVIIGIFAAFAVALAILHFAPRHTCQYTDERTGQVVTTACIGR